VAFVADEDDRSVVAVDLDARRALTRTKLDSRPGQMMVSSDGRLLVALRDEATLAAFRATDDASAPLEEVAHAATAVEPIALAATPDDATVLVAAGWGHALQGFRTGTLENTMTVPVPREPRAVTTSADGSTAFVAHAIASLVTFVDLRPSAAAKPMAVDAIDISTGPYLGGDDEVGPNFVARKARGAFAIARLDGKRERLFVPYVLVDPGNNIITTGYGGAVAEAGPVIPNEVFANDHGMRTMSHVIVGHTAGTQVFDVDTIDPKKKTLVGGGGMPTVVQDTTRAGKGACLLPRAAVVDAEDGELLVACRGVDEVRAYDANKDDPTGWKPKRRWNVPAGPSGIAVDPEHHEAIVWSAFDGVVTVISLLRGASVDGGPPAPGGTASASTASAAEPARIQIVRDKPLAADVALGRKLFFTAGDPRIAKDGRACASCHIDGREDGLVWSSPKGGRQTMMLAGRVDHAPPFGWLGEHESIAVHLAQTLKNLGGTGLEGAEVDALVAWVKTMPGPPDDSRPESAEEARGREIFGGSVANCTSCHVPPAKGSVGAPFRDQMTHDVGTGGPFLTPSLRYVGATPPYFHDGRYATLEELLKDPKGRMGEARKLPKEDLDALALYLRTL
jgi:mono/diheme cytochrome c family protein